MSGRSLNNIKNSETQRVVKLAENLLLQRVSETACLLKLDESWLLHNCDDSNSHSRCLEIKNRHLRAWQKSIIRAATSSPENWLIDCVLSYDSLLLEFDQDTVDYFTVVQLIDGLVVDTDHSMESTIIHRIPICYGLSNDSSYPSDIGSVLEQTKLSLDKLIELHTTPSYQVFAVGFMPNFAYLGSVPSKLSIPRLKSPRAKVPSGALAVADDQTAIYPNESPGGWHIIGYTPLNLSVHSNIQFSPGDEVKFYPITQETFLQQVGRAAI